MFPLSKFPLNPSLKKKKKKKIRTAFPSSLFSLPPSSFSPPRSRGSRGARQAAGGQASRDAGLHGPPPCRRRPPALRAPGSLAGAAGAGGWRSTERPVRLRARRRGGRALRHQSGRRVIGSAGAGPGAGTRGDTHTGTHRHGLRRAHASEHAETHRDTRAHTPRPCVTGTATAG